MSFHGTSKAAQESLHLLECFSMMIRCLLVSGQVILERLSELERIET